MSVYTMGTTASALEISLSRDVEKNMVTGTVTTDAGTENAPVLIQTVSEAGDVIYLNQIYTDSSGRASFNYIHEVEIAGAGIMSVTAKSISESNFATYNQASEEEVDTIVQTVKTECAKELPDIDVIRDAYILNTDKLDFDLTEYNTLADGNGAEKIVFSHIANDTENKTKIHTITDVIKAFYAGVAVAVINKSGQADDVVDLINNNKYVHTFNFDSIPKDAEGISVFDGLTEDVKKKIYEKLASSDSRSAADLAQKLVLYTLTEELRYGDFNNVNKMLKAYSDAGLISLSMSAYNTLNNKNAVDKLMSGVEYTSYDAVETRFAEMVDAQYSAEHPTGNPGGNGGNTGNTGNGGGGNYSKKSFSFAAAPQPNTNNGISDTTETNSDNGLLSGKMIFADMEQAKWAIEPVEALYKMGIINGTDNDSFEPNRGINRAEFVKILVCMAEIPLDTSENIFTDVAEESWYYRYASAAFKAGVVMGDDEGRFNGNKIITREEMAAMIYRIMNKMEISPTESDTLGFDDDELISAWAKESVNYLKRCGIVNGRNKNFYEPKAELTRAEAAAVVHKVLKTV